MTNTLLMRFVAPMQSWGVGSNFDYRDTGLEPSKSGVVGLLCAALGHGRDLPLDERFLAARLGVRVDREGVPAYDYQVAGVGGMLDANGKVSDKNVTPSWRSYLADAAFLVGLESEDAAWLEQLQTALRRPVWPLFLGRKAFPPAEPIAFPEDALLPGDLSSVLAHAPRIRSDPRSLDPRKRMRALLEDPEGPIVRMDQPLSFANRRRRFGLRRVRVCLFDDPGSAQ